MKPKEVQAALAVPEQNDRILCERCFAFVDADADACPECGAPVNAKTVGEAEAQVHSELAQANLLRIRGELKVASDLCLGVLRRYPNNATANTILGDIAMERGEFDQAVEWYELALDIVPDSAEDRRKLEAAKAKSYTAGLAITAKDMDLPKQQRFPWATVGAIFGIAAVLILAAIFFSLVQLNPVEVKTDNRPIIIKSEPAPASVPVVAPTPESEDPPSERKLADDIADLASVSRERITGFAVDAKDGSVLIKYVLKSADDEELEVQSRLIKAAFSKNTKAPLVTLDTYLGKLKHGSTTVELSTYEESQSPEFLNKPNADERTITLFFPRISGKGGSDSPSEGAVEAPPSDSAPVAPEPNSGPGGTTP